jgi:hypothetical protein
MSPLPTGIRTTPENMVILLQHLTDDEPEPRDPTEAELDAWMRNDEVDE